MSCADKIRKRPRFISDEAVLFEAAAGTGVAFAGPDMAAAADFAAAGSSEGIRVWAEISFYRPVPHVG